jgi:hypothetical protein
MEYWERRFRRSRYGVYDRLDLQAFSKKESPRPSIAVSIELLKCAANVTSNKMEH